MNFGVHAMKPTIRNKIKLWWHCLIHLHCEGTESEKRPGKLFFKTTAIYCYTCSYGKEKKKNESLCNQI